MSFVSGRKKKAMTKLIDATTIGYQSPNVIDPCWAFIANTVAGSSPIDF